MRLSPRLHFVRSVAASILALLGMSTTAVDAVAATGTSNLLVSALVSNSCLISALPVVFGLYDPTGANAASNRSATGSVTVVCTIGASAVVTLGQGAQPVGAVDAAPVRQMASGGNMLAYFLYQNVGATTVWGNTGATGLAAVADGFLHTSTVYGVIPAGQNVPSGIYGDTVVATVTF